MSRYPQISDKKGSDMKVEWLIDDYRSARIGMEIRQRLTDSASNVKTDAILKVTGYRMGKESRGLF